MRGPPRRHREFVRRARRSGEPGKGRRWLVALAVAATSLTTTRTARADGAGVIVASSSDRAQVAAALATAMAGRSTRLVPDAVAAARSAHAAGAVPMATLARFRRVREQIDDGWKAYLRVAVEVAAVKLATARADAEALVALPGGPELYADAALRLGAVLGHLGRTTESRAALALALALDPDRPVTLAEFSPDVLERIEAVREDPTPAAMVALGVTVTPPGAMIAIDGGVPVRASTRLAIASGQHLVTARAPGFVPTVRAVATTASGTQVDLRLDVDEAATRLATGATRGLAEPAAQRLIEATLAYGDFDEIVVATTTERRGGPTLLVQRCAGAPARCSAVVEVGYGAPAGLAAAAREAWAAARVGELRYAPTVLADRGHARGRGGDARCGTCRSPWLWGGVGAAVVIGALVTMFAVTGEDPVPTVGVDPSLFKAR